MMEALVVLLYGMFLVALIYFVMEVNMNESFSLKDGSSAHGVVFEEYVEENKYFTESERQQLQAQLTEVISLLELDIMIDLYHARRVKESSDNSFTSYYYKQVEKRRKKLKSLVALQTKVKHSLETRG